MTDDEQMPAEQRYGLFLAMVHLGAAMTILLIATLVFDLPDFIDGFPQGVLLIALSMTLRRKLRDEYVQRLWDAGTDTAFVVITSCFLLVPTAMTLLGGTLASAWLPTSMAMQVQWPAAVALVGFYSGFYWRMLSGAGPQ